MKLKKYLKILSLSLCITLSATGLAFAETNNTMESQITLETTDLNQSVSNESIVENKAIYDKQVEIDEVLFKANSSELEKRGIFVTHTFATEEFVEIGISPFSEENEDFIYGLLGKDLIKVVEGDTAVTLDGSLAADGSQAAPDAQAQAEPYKSETAKLQTTNIAVDSVTEEKDKMSPVLIATAVAAVILGALFFIKKFKSA